MIRARVVAWMCVLFASATVSAAGQEADPLPTKPDTSLRFPNTTAGEFTPSTGFTIIRTAKGSLNISVYGLFRHINQLPGSQTFVDHLGIAGINLAFLEVDGFVDVNVDGVQCLSQWRWRGRLVGGK